MFHSVPPLPLAFSISPPFLMKWLLSLVGRRYHPDVLFMPEPSIDPLSLHSDPLPLCKIVFINIGMITQTLTVHLILTLIFRPYQNYSLRDHCSSLASDSLNFMSKTYIIYTSCILHRLARSTHSFQSENMPL